MQPGKKVADDKLAGIGKRLEKSGIKEEDLEKGLDQLATERDQPNETMQEAAKQPNEAKSSTIRRPTARSSSKRWRRPSRRPGRR